MKQITIGGEVFNHPPLKNTWNLRQQAIAKNALGNNFNGNLMQSLIFGETTAELLGVVLWNKDEEKFNPKTYKDRVELIKDLNIEAKDEKVIEGIITDFWNTRGRSMMSATRAYTAVANKGQKTT